MKPAEGTLSLRRTSDISHAVYLDKVWIVSLVSNEVIFLIDDCKRWDMDGICVVF